MMTLKVTYPTRFGHGEFEPGETAHRGRAELHSAPEGGFPDPDRSEGELRSALNGWFTTWIADVVQVSVLQEIPRPLIDEGYLERIVTDTIGKTPHSIMCSLHGTHDGDGRTPFVSLISWQTATTDQFGFVDGWSYALVERAWLLGPDGGTIERIVP